MTTFFKDLLLIIKNIPSSFMISRILRIKFEQFNVNKEITFDTN